MVEKPTDADWILKTMVAMAAADGRLDAREVGLIQKVYQDQTGRSVDVSGVVLAVQAYATKRDVLRSSRCWAHIWKVRPARLARCVERSEPARVHAQIPP